MAHQGRRRSGRGGPGKRVPGDLAPDFEGSGDRGARKGQTGDPGRLLARIGPAAPAMAQAFAGFLFAPPPALPLAAPVAPAVAAAPGPSLPPPRSGPGVPPAAAPGASQREPASRPTGDAPAPSGQPSAHGARALDVARQEIGVAEDPPKSNRGARVEEYQRGSAGQPWCAHFVSWCVARAGQSPFGHLASVAALRDWARGRGKYLPASGSAPLAGDIFTMSRHDQSGREVGGHTGFVAAFDARTQRIRTVEGNAGDRVAERSYALSALDGFIRL